MGEAESARERGNALFKAGNFPEASAEYDVALGLLKAIEGEEAMATTIKCRLNKAACMLKVQGYAAAGAECHSVLELEPFNAKAYFRMGQAAEKMGDFASAQKALTESIKLVPSLKEPRKLLDEIKAKLKGNPRLEQAIQDMTLVEERALRALNWADTKRARQQLESLLKDARREKEHHWEVRALLGLALLCEDEGEVEGAQDYLDAARRCISAHNDRRAELYCLLTHALIFMDQEHLQHAKPMLEGGLMLANEMGEKGLAARFVGDLAVVHNARGDYGRGFEYATQALGSSRERADSHFEAVASIALATSMRHMRRFEEAHATLVAALILAEALAYSHVLAAGLRQLAFLKFEWDSAGKDRFPSGIKLLERAHKIAEKNGVRRAAVDDAYNLYSARLRFRFGSRVAALEGLAKTLAATKELQYKRTRVDVLIAIALSHMRDPTGGVAWSSDPADLHEAETHLDAALTLVEPKSTTHEQVLTQRTLLHLLRAGSGTASAPGPDAPSALGWPTGGDGAGEDASEALKALCCAEQIVCIKSGIPSVAEAVGKASEPADLINLAIAIMAAKRSVSSQLVEDAVGAASAAKAALERALSLCGGDHETRGRALLARASTHGALGETASAAADLGQVLQTISVGGMLMSEKAAELKAKGDACVEKDPSGAVAAYKEAIAAASVKESAASEEPFCKNMSNLRDVDDLVL